MADCKLTNQQVNLRADKVFGLGYLDKRREYAFLEAMINERVRPLPIRNELGECVSVFVKWKDICAPAIVPCDNSCDFTPVNDENCIEETYTLDNCFRTQDYAFNTAEYECLRDPNSGELLSHTLEETIAKTELEHEAALIQDAIIPYIIGVIEGAVSAPAPADTPNSVTVSGNTVNIKPSQVGESLYVIIKELVRKNQITRPLIVVGHQALENAHMVHEIKKESALLDKLFGSFPIYFDYDNIFGTLGEEAIYVINLDAFALFTYHKSTPNVTATTDLLSPTWGESILRWHETSRFASPVLVDKYQKITCISDDHELIARRAKAHVTLLEAPDGVCNQYPKVIKIQCAAPTVVVGP